MIKILSICALIAVLYGPVSSEVTRQDVLNAMTRATEYFRREIATEGGYLWRYKDLSLIHI